MKYTIIGGALGISFLLYVSTWGFFVAQYENSKNIYKTKLEIANTIGYQVDAITFTRPSFWLLDVSNNLQQQNTLNQEIELDIVALGNSIKEEIVFLNKDNVELLRQAKNLSLTGVALNEQEALHDPRTSEDVLLLFKTKTEAQQNITSIKAVINDLYSQKKSNNEFANPLWGYTDRELLSLTDNMTIAEKAGQFLIFSIAGQYSTASFAQDLKNEMPSGIIYMGYNVANQKQLKDFSTSIQNTNNKIPLFIATDQEGGVVKRINWDSTSGQSAWDKMSLEELCNQAIQRGKILKLAGINLNFSPVVDLSNADGGFINNRTISTDPAKVLEKAQKYVECIQAQGISATLKHYPGHGATSEDSHFKLPIINKSKADWLVSDAIPFKSITGSKAIMLGHLMFFNIDPNEPSTLSTILVTDILRKEFNYSGLIITDDMNMLHTSINIGVKEAMQKSINAGVNQLLYVGFPKPKNELIEILSSLIETGGVEPVRVQESLIKVLQAKRDLI